MFKRILAMTFLILLIAVPGWSSIEIQDDGVPVGIVNSINFAGSTVTQSGSVGSVTLNDINSGTIDGAVIGGSTPAAGTFTTLTANTSITLNGITITDWGGVVSPWTDTGATTTLNSAPTKFIATHGSGNFFATQLECGTGDLVFENGQIIDGGTDEYIKLIENGDTLSLYFQGSDVHVLSSDGGVIFDLNEADGDVEFRTRNDDNDYFQFYTAANIPTIATPAGDDGDIAIIPGGGDVALTGNLAVSGTISGTFSITSVTMGDDILSRPADDVLRWTPNDEHATIEAYGFTAKDGRLLLTSNASAVNGDEWMLQSDGDGTQSLIITNDTSGAHLAVWQMTTAGDITMEGDVITLGDDEYLSNAVDGTIMAATNTEDIIFLVKSNNAADGTSSLILAGDAIGDAGDQWRLQAGGADEDLVISNDTAVSGTFVTKLTIADTDGDITTTGDIEIIDDMDLVFGTDADVKIQYDEGVDDQCLFVTTTTDATATTDPLFEFLVPAAPGADQQVFGVAKGTQATNTALFTVDEDGDVEVANDLSSGGDITVTGADIQLGATGVKISSDNDGAITLLGCSAGADEDLTINLDDVADEITVSTSTAATLFNLDGALDLKVSGLDLTIGDTGVQITSDNDGAITFLGLSAGADEDFTINLDDTADTIVVSTSTSADSFLLNDIGITLAEATTASQPLLWLENTKDDATSPIIRLEKDRATESDGDDCGYIYFTASDDGDATFDAVTILGEAVDVTATDEAGKLTIDVEVDDVATEMLVMRGDTGAATGHIEFNGDTADVDFHYDGNTTADYLLIDATLETTTLTSAVTLMPTVTLENTTNDTVASSIHFLKDKGAAGANGDDAGSILFSADDATQTETDVAKILAEIEDTVDTDEAGKLTFQVMFDDGTPALEDFLVLDGEGPAAGQGAIAINSAGKDINTVVKTASSAPYFVIDAGTDETKLASAVANMPTLNLKNTRDAADCPIFQLESDRATPADGDDCGKMEFKASDSAGNQIVFATILAEANEVNDADEAGKISVNLEMNDADTQFVQMFGDTTGAATGHVEFNSGSVDIDFHIDTDNVADAFLLNAGSDALGINVETLISEELDITCDAADEELNFLQTAVAGTADTPFILIDDERTGATANVKGEASLMIDPQGTHAINIVDGILYTGGAINMGDDAVDAGTFVMQDGAQAGDGKATFAMSGDGNGDFSITLDDGSIVLNATGTNQDITFNCDDADTDVQMMKLTGATPSVDIGTSTVAVGVTISNAGVLTLYDAGNTHSATLAAATDGSNLLNITGDVTISSDLTITGNGLNCPTDLLITPSGNEVHIDGGLDVGGTTAVGDNNLRVTGLYAASSEIATAVGDAGAIDETVSIHYLVSDGGADTNEDTFTLEDGSLAGEIHYFIFKTDTDTGDSVNITPSSCGWGTKITLDTDQEGATLIWDGTNWYVVATNGGVSS